MHHSEHPHGAPHCAHRLAWEHFREASGFCPTVVVLTNGLGVFSSIFDLATCYIAALLAVQSKDHKRLVT